MLDRHPTWLVRMLVLMVTAFHSHQIPTILLDHPDHLPTPHSLRPVRQQLRRNVGGGAGIEYTPYTLCKILVDFVTPISRPDQRLLRPRKQYRGPEPAGLRRVHCQQGRGGIVNPGVCQGNVEHNITVNAVAPGPVATDLFLHGKSEEQIQTFAKIAPLERLGQPEDIARVVSFLAGPESAWVNGQILRVNGGLV